MLADQLLELLSLLARLLPPGDEPQRILRLVQRALDDPKELRRDLVTQIMSAEIKFDDFAADKDMFSKILASPRRILDEAKKEFPAGRPGRPAKPVDEDRLARLAKSLLPICRALLTLRSHPTKQTLAASIEYLSLDFPDVAGFLLQRVGEVEAILGDRDLLKGVRNLEGKARVLAYVIAGEESGYHGTYALRKTRTAVNRRKRFHGTKP